MGTPSSVITTDYALYLGDCIDVMGQLKDATIDLSIYSPPFPTASGGLYTYSSSEQDLSNCANREEFHEHYGFVIDAIARLTKPGRMTAVHCADIPTGNSGHDAMHDLPGDIIRWHEQRGWVFTARYHIWKEPLGVRNRTMAKGLAHKTIVEDSTRCSLASADQLLIFRNCGKNAVPVAHPHGLTEYIGERHVPHDLLQYRNWQGSQLENKYSHWVWRQYASAFWDDVRIDRVLPYRQARDAEDERHMHPLQLDVIERGITLWSNPGEVVLTPFMGVGSECFGALTMGRKAIGIELKPSYYRQAVKNVAEVKVREMIQQEFFPVSPAQDTLAFTA